MTTAKSAQLVCIFLSDHIKSLHKYIPFLKPIPLLMKVKSLIMRTLSLHFITHTHTHTHTRV